MDNFWEKELKDAILNNRSNQIEHMQYIIKRGVNINWKIPGGMGRTLLFLSLDQILIP